MVYLLDAKLFLRVTHDEEDDDIQQMLDAATAAAEDYLNASFTGTSAIPMAAPIKAAILLQVGDLFENRERQGTEAYYQNRTYERLLNPYRVMDI